MYYLTVFSFLMIILLSFSSVLFSYSLAEPIKAAIITFDDEMLSQYTYAKPILDKYNFKATFYIICNSVDKENRMNWNNIQTLEEEEHEIGSHSMTHKRLSTLSEEEIRYEIIEAKRCLQEKGFNVTSFSFPYNDGDNNKNILKIVADNYYIARTASEPLMLFQCRSENEENNNNNNDDDDDDDDSVGNQQVKSHNEKSSKEAKEYDINSNTKVIFICNNENHELRPINSNNLTQPLTNDGILLPTHSPNNHNNNNNNNNGENKPITTTISYAQYKKSISND
jgi:peptidoglycan/xylan/chitin deacetylase (PgdA/CDA1 family)